MRLTNFPSALANRPLRQRRRSPAYIRYGVRAGAAIVILLLVVVVAAIVAVLSGPMELSVVRDRIVATLQRNIGDSYNVAAGKAVIDVDPALGLVIKVDDIEVRDGQDAVVAHVPSTRLAISPLSLLRLRVNVSTVELAGAQLSFVRSSDGQVFLGNAATIHAARKTSGEAPAADPLTADGGFPDIFRAMQIVDHGLEPSISAAVKAGFLHFSLVDSKIDVWDAEHAQQRTLPDTDLNVTVDPTTSSLAATFASSGFGGRWTATFERDKDPATGERTMSAVFSQLTLADVFPKLGDKEGWLDADVPLFGHATVRYAPDGAVADATMQLDVGAGVFSFGDTKETVQIDEGTLKLRWDIPNKVVIVDPSPFYFGETRGVVSGWVKPDGDPAARRYAFSLESKGAILKPRDSSEPPLVADRIAVSGLADVPNRLVTFDNAAIVSSQASITASGKLKFEDPSPSLVMNATFSPMSASAVKQLWVPFIAPAARRWVLQHVTAGQITAGRFEANVPPGILWTGKRLPIPEDAMRLDLRIEDASFTTFGDLPPIVRASGNAVLAGSTFGIDLEKGEVDTPSGTVEVNAGAFAVSNTVQRNPDGVIEVQLSGDAAPLGEIANVKPFLALDRRQITPADLTGKGDASVSIKLPLRAGITPSDVDWRITVNATDLASAKPLEGRTIGDADVVFTITPDDVSIKGKAKIDGVPADVSMIQPINESGAATTGPGRELRLTLDAAARKKLGMGLDQILGGTIGATVTNIEDGSAGQHYELDLKKARLTLPGVSWSKGVGVPATLSFDLKIVDGGYSVENLMLTGSGFGFSGSAKLDKSYGLISADLDHFALHQGDSVSFKLTRNRAGYAITAEGSSFDVQGVISHLRDQTSSDSDAPDLSIDARIGQMGGFNQQVINDASLSLVFDGGAVRKFAFTGSIDGAPLAASYDDEPTGTTLFATAEDTGKFFSFIDLYTRFQGGRLKLTGQSDGTGPLAGSLEVYDFDILNEPEMQHVVASAPLHAKSGINTARVHFDKMIARYRKTSQVIAIDEALLRGNTNGATFNGRYDLTRKTISINGTYLPAYAFNNAFSKVPIVGLVLSGGFSEGLFGVTFKVEGPITGPRVLVNPLSAVAPGIFRKIFEFH